MSVRVNGHAIAESIKQELKKEISQHEQEISFHVVYVGNDPVIDNFIHYKKKFGHDIGVEVVVHRFDEYINEVELVGEIEIISQRADALIIQLPLPDHLDTQNILDSVPKEKDVDVLGTSARDMFRSGETDLVPPVTGAILEVFKIHDVDLGDKNIVLIGNGALVGKPTIAWLEREHYDYHIVNKDTSHQDIISLASQADVIISGAGAPHFVQPEMVRSGVVLIDAGTGEAGKKILGDIDPACYSKASLVTSVPGGIGPITIAVLYQNILKAYRHVHR